MPKCRLKVSIDANTVRSKRLKGSYGILNTAVQYGFVKFWDPSINWALMAGWVGEMLNPPLAMVGSVC